MTMLLNTGLRRYLDKLKVSDTETAKRDILPVVDEIRKIIAERDTRFESGLVFKGSIYEKAKIKSADEFDFELPIPSLRITDAPNCKLPVTSSVYTTYALVPSSQPQWDDLVNGDLVSSEKFFQRFSNLVKVAVEQINGARRNGGFTVNFSTNNPSVMLTFQRYGQIVYSIDLVPAIEVENWPINLTREWQCRRRGWPTQDVVRSIVENIPVYLVPKLSKDGDERRDMLWRYAFNKAEHRILNSPDTVIANNCRKDVLRVLKGLLVDLKWPGLKTYYLKTLMLHEFESRQRDDWKATDLGQRVIDAVTRLRDCVSNGYLEHYFLSDCNILSKLSQEQKMQLRVKLDKFLGNPNAIINALTGETNDFQVFVRNLDGKVITLLVRNDYTIQKLKEMVSGRTEMSASQMRLVFEGRNLENGTIQSNGIKAENTIELMGRLRGGGVGNTQNGKGMHEAGKGPSHL